MGAPIYTQDTSGIAEGITRGASALGQALGQALSKRGEQKRQDKRQLHQMGSIGKAFSAIDPDTPVNEQFSAFQQALKEGGVPVDPRTAVQYFQVMQKSQQSSQKNKLRIDDVNAINEIAGRLGKDASFEDWLNALSLSGIDPAVSEKFLLNKYRSQLLKTREGESDTSTKRLSREERNQRMKLLESDYKERLADLKADMNAAKAEFRDDDVKRINQDIKNLRKQRIGDRKLVMKGEAPLLYGEDQGQGSLEAGEEKPGKEGAANDLNSILFG